MKCPKCNASNPVDANFCFDCGTDLRAVSETVPMLVDKADDNVRIVDTLNFKGGVIRVNEILFDYNTIYTDIIRLMDDKADSFEHHILEMESLEERLNGIPSATEESVKAVISYAIRKYVVPRQGYIYDTGTIYEENGEDLLEPMLATYADYCKKYLAILASQAEFEEQLKERQNSASQSWMGFGFGLKGAIKSAVNVSILNAASGAIAGFSGGISKRAYSQKVEKQIKQLYENRDFVKSQVYALRECGPKIVNIIAELCQIPNWACMSTRELRSLFFEGVCNEELNIDTRTKYLCQCFEEAPYNLDFYDQACKMYGKFDIEIYILAKYFGQEKPLKFDFLNSIQSCPITRPKDSSYQSYVATYTNGIEFLRKMSLIEPADEKSNHVFWQPSDYAKKHGVAAEVESLWNIDIAPLEKSLIRDAHNVGLYNVESSDVLLQGREAQLSKLSTGKNGTFVSRCLSLLREQRETDFYMTSLDEDSEFKKLSSDWSSRLFQSELRWITPRAFIYFSSCEPTANTKPSTLAITVAGLILDLGSSCDLIPYDVMTSIYEERVDVGEPYKQYKVSIEYCRKGQADVIKFLYCIDNDTFGKLPHFNVGELLRKSLYAYEAFGEEADAIERIHNEQAAQEESLSRRLEQAEKSRFQAELIQQAEIARKKKDEEEAERQRVKDLEEAQKKKQEQKEQKRKELEQKKAEDARSKAQQAEYDRLAREKYEKEHPIACRINRAASSVSAGASDAVEGASLVFFIICKAIPYLLGLCVVGAIAYYAISGIKQGYTAAVSSPQGGAATSPVTENAGTESKKTPSDDSANADTEEAVPAEVPDSMQNPSYPCAVDVVTKGSNYWDTEHGFTVYVPDEYNFGNYSTWLRSDMEGSDAQFMLAVDAQGLSSVSRSIQTSIANAGTFGPPKMSETDNDHFVHSGYASVNGTDDYIYYYQGREINNYVVVVSFLYPVSLRERYDAQVELVTVTLQPLPTADRALTPVAREPDFYYSDSRSLYTTAESGLVLRAGPSKDYDKVFSIPYSSTVALLGGANETEDWCYVSYGDLSGWVSTQYLAGSPQ